MFFRRFRPYMFCHVVVLYVLSQNHFNYFLVFNHEISRTIFITNASDFMKTATCRKSEPRVDLYIVSRHKNELKLKIASFHSVLDE
jgi:hypothetical protein